MLGADYGNIIGKASQYSLKLFEALKCDNSMRTGEMRENGQFYAN